MNTTKTAEAISLSPRSVSNYILPFDKEKVFVPKERKKTQCEKQPA